MKAWWIEEIWMQETNNKMEKNENKTGWFFALFVSAKRFKTNYGHLFSFHLSSSSYLVRAYWHHATTDLMMGSVETCANFMDSNGKCLHFHWTTTFYACSYCWMPLLIRTMLNKNKIFIFKEIRMRDGGFSKKKICIYYGGFCLVIAWGQNALFAIVQKIIKSKLRGKTSRLFEIKKVVNYLFWS